MQNVQFPKQPCSTDHEARTTKNDLAFPLFFVALSCLWTTAAPWALHPRRLQHLLHLVLVAITPLALNPLPKM